tara:strand:- start:1037 stop:2488 length:1452 start_codon:yes stop_codon:yes gene_type:complete
MPNKYGFQFDNTYLTLPNVFYTQMNPTPVSKPELVLLNSPLVTSLELNDVIKNDAALLFSGHMIPEGACPFAQAYAGHQFGHFTMLGDGRAHVLGEHITPDGQRVDIQFKGSGRTPYSRQGDGRASFGPMLREYIMSEAMHSLGIPTTRSLAVVKTGEDVFRETVLPGAILTRVATSHIRVGSFEFAASNGDQSLVERLLNYTVERHMPDIMGSENLAVDFLKAVMNQQADLMVHWMRVGFIHGVMNTDNMAISGETIDYGPCAFMDNYDPATVFSSIDRMGRYAFANQPKIAQWNLARLAESLLPLMDQHQDKAIQLAKEVIEEFPSLYNDRWLHMMKCKLGLFGEEPEDDSLISNLLDWMKKNHMDYTNTFLDLSQEVPPAGKPYQTEEFRGWHADLKRRYQKNQRSIKESMALMTQYNPKVIPRNHHVEGALDEALNGNLTRFKALLNVLSNPYEASPHLNEYQSPPAPSDRVYQTFCGT